MTTRKQRDAARKAKRLAQEQHRRDKKAQSDSGVQGSLSSASEEVRQLFEQFEAVIKGQMSSSLDDVEALPLRVVSEDGVHSAIDDLLAFPSWNAVSFRTRQGTPYLDAHRL